MYINVVSPFVNQPPPNLPSMADIWLSECIFSLVYRIKQEGACTPNMELTDTKSATK